MQPSTILTRCLSEAFGSIHQSTVPAIGKATDAIGAGNWLTLIAIARRWPGAERVAAPLKAADRLLRSPVLTQAHRILYGAMCRWLIRQRHPLIAVDWSDLKADGSFKLLRASLAVRGHAITLWEEVHPQTTAGSVPVECQFLRTLATLLPDTCQPILLTDGGFRRPWFRQVQELGWHYVGRVRGTVTMQARSRSTPDTEAWQSRSHVQKQARVGRSLELGPYWLGRRHCLATRLVIYAGHPQGRHALTLRGQRRADSTGNQAARAGREPWMLATSLPVHDWSAAQVRRCYARRMTIEQAFRDLKSSAFGAGFEHSLTHKRGRLGNLLLLFALTQFAAWLVGLCDHLRGQPHRLATCRHPRRRQYSLWRTGMEILAHPDWGPSASVLRSFLHEVADTCPPALSTQVTK